MSHLMFDRETTEIYNDSYHVVGLRGLKGGGGGGGGGGEFINFN